MCNTYPCLYTHSYLFKLNNWLLFSPEYKWTLHNAQMGKWVHCSSSIWLWICQVKQQCCLHTTISTFNNMPICTPSSVLGLAISLMPTTFPFLACSWCPQICACFYQQGLFCSCLTKCSYSIWPFEEPTANSQLKECEGSQLTFPKVQDAMLRQDFQKRVPRGLDTSDDFNQEQM